MIFAYRAVDASGIETRGKLDASSETEVIRKLNSRNLTVVYVIEQGLAKRAKRPARASVQERVMSLHEMVTLLESGVSIVDTIESQASGNYPAELETNYKKMALHIKKGESFSSALYNSGLDLPEYMFQLCKAGELAGDLPGSLRNGLSQYEYELAIQKEFRNALTYPLILVLSGISAVILIFALVVPKFIPLLERSEELPLISKVIFSIGVFFNDHALFILLGAAGFFMAAISLFQRKNIQEKIYDLGCRLPILGDWLIEIDIARWCSTLAALLGSRVEVMQALQLANEGIFSPTRRAGFDRVVISVKQGTSLAESLEKEGTLTPVGYNLIRSGEKAGKVPEMASALAKIYDEAGKNRMRQTVNLVEPLSILSVGLFIGAIVLGVMLAITSVNTVTF